MADPLAPARTRLSVDDRHALERAVHVCRRVAADLRARAALDPAPLALLRVATEQDAAADAAQRLLTGEA